MSGDALGWIAKCHRDENGRRQRGEGGKKKGGIKRKRKIGRKDKDEKKKRRGALFLFWHEQGAVHEGARK